MGAHSDEDGDQRSDRSGADAAAPDEYRMLDMMHSSETCTRCGAAVPSDEELPGVCAVCAFGLALDRSRDENAHDATGAHDTSDPSRTIPNRRPVPSDRENR